MRSLTFMRGSVLPVGAQLHNVCDEAGAEAQGADEPRSRSHGYATFCILFA